MSPRPENERQTGRANDPRGAKVRSFRIEVTSGKSKGAKVSSRDGEVRIGAAAGNDLVIDDALVSSHHLELGATFEGVWLKDLGSTNGTEVDGYRTSAIVLRGEAKIRVGETELWYAEEGSGAALPVSQSTSFGEAVSVSHAMRRVFAILERVAPTNATVLIEGESGTGKEVLARGLHDHSTRKTKPYVVIDCGATAASLLEAELFGHAKGAFTGAIKDRPGLVESANGGTLFLDEIGEMPLELQTKLLGVLERRSYRRIGTTEERPVDVRFVAATNRDLRHEVNEGHFRADLWHRLAVVRVVVPPLRQRTEDILPIARRILGDMAKRYKIADPSAILSEDALQKLVRHRWSGNVRELRNHLERALAMSSGGEFPDIEATMPEVMPDGEIDAADLTGTFKDAKGRHTAVFEKAYLRELLERHRGNLSAAAREADLSRLHLRTLARRYGIQAGDDKD